MTGDPIAYFPPNLDAYAPWVAKRGLVEPYGQCQCGCGQTTSIARLTNRERRGHLAGHPVPYINGHFGTKQTLYAAFWGYVTAGDPNVCWEWQGCVMPKGYGLLRHRPTSPKQMVAHRVSYQLHFGPIPDGIEVCHTCDNPPCVNPKHLFLGTIKDNYDDMLAKNRHYPAFARKLSDVDRAQIVELRSSGRTLMAIAELYPVHFSTIWKVIKRAEREVIR